MKQETIDKQNARRCPLVTVDIIIADLYNPRKIVLIERKNEPRGTALPGGFVDIGETTMAAAIREAKEETGLDIFNVKQFHTFSDPARDARGHAITVVYYANASGIPRGLDDAAEANWLEWDNDRYEYYFKRLCFDHAKIIGEYVNYVRNGERPTRE